MSAYFIQREGLQYLVEGLGEIQELVRMGCILPDDRVREAGGQWQSARAHRDLIPVFEEDPMDAWAALESADPDEVWRRLAVPLGQHPGAAPPAAPPPVPAAPPEEAVPEAEDPLWAEPPSLGGSAELGRPVDTGPVTAPQQVRPPEPSPDSSQRAARRSAAHTDRVSPAHPGGLRPREPEGPRSPSAPQAVPPSHQPGSLRKVVPFSSSRAQAGVPSSPGAGEGRAVSDPGTLLPFPSSPSSSMPMSDAEIRSKLTLDLQAPSPAASRVNFWRVGPLVLLMLLVFLAINWWVPRESQRAFSSGEYTPRERSGALPAPETEEPEAVPEAEEPAQDSAPPQPLNLELEQLLAELKGQLPSVVKPLPGEEEFEAALLIDLSRFELRSLQLKVEAIRWEEGGEPESRLASVRIQFQTAGQLERELTAVALVLGKYLDHDKSIVLEPLELRVLQEEGQVSRAKLSTESARRLYSGKLSIEGFLKQLSR